MKKVSFRQLCIGRFGKEIWKWTFTAIWDEICSIETALSERKYHLTLFPLYGDAIFSIELCPIHTLNPVTFCYFLYPSWESVCVLTGPIVWYRLCLFFVLCSFRFSLYKWGKACILVNGLLGFFQPKIRSWLPSPIHNWHLESFIQSAKEGNEKPKKTTNPSLTSQGKKEGSKRKVTSWTLSPICHSPLLTYSKQTKHRCSLLLAVATLPKYLAVNSSLSSAAPIPSALLSLAHRPRVILDTWTTFLNSTKNSQVLDFWSGPNGLFRTIRP